MGPEHLIKYVSAAHTRICFSSVSPLQEAAAVGFEEADQNGFWDKSRAEMKGKVERFCEVFDELGIPVSRQSIKSPNTQLSTLPLPSSPHHNSPLKPPPCPPPPHQTDLHSTQPPKAATSSSPTSPPSPSPRPTPSRRTSSPARAISTSPTS